MSELEPAGRPDFRMAGEEPLPPTVTQKIDSMLRQAVAGVYDIRIDTSRRAFAHHLKDWLQTDAALLELNDRPPLTGYNTAALRVDPPVLSWQGTRVEHLPAGQVLEMARYLRGETTDPAKRALYAMIEALAEQLRRVRP